MPEGIISNLFDIIILIICSAILSASEAAFFTIESGRLKELARSEERSPWNFFRIVYERPVDVLIMIIMGNEIVNITATVIMTAIIISIAGEDWKFLAIPIMLPLIIILGDIIPKVLAINYAERFAKAIALPYAVLYRVLSPIIGLFRNMTDLFTKGIFLKGVEEKNESQSEDLNLYLEIGEESGVLEPSEKNLLENIFSLDKSEVWEIMRTRREIFYIHYNTPDEVLLSEIKKKGFAKIPVVDSTIDDIRGVLHVKDLLAIKNKDGIKNWQNVLRKPEFVYRNRKIGALLKDMKERNFTICFVINEYGRVIGLVTMTDILQRIFKGIDFSVSFPGWMSEQLSDGSFIISQTMQVSLFNEFFNANIPTAPYKTMGRFLKSVLGRAPQIGDRIEYDRWVFTLELGADSKSKIIRVREKSVR